MKRLLMTVLFLNVISFAFAQVAGTTIKGQKPDGSFEFIKTNGSGKMEVNAAVTASLDTTQTLKVQTDQNTGCKDASGGPFSITSGKTNITFPDGTIGFGCNAFGGDIIVNHQNRLATGTFYVGWKVASGTVGIWNGLASGTTYTFSFSSNSVNNATATFFWW